MIHIAGVHVEIDNRLRQRCAWCGKTLLDYDLTRIMVPVGQEGPPGVWSVGSLVAHEEHACFSVEHNPADPLPLGTCTRLDPAVTK